MWCFRLLLLALVCATTSGCALESKADLDELWEMQTRAGFDAMRDGHIEDSIARYRAALETSKSLQFSSMMTARSYINLGKALAQKPENWQAAHGAFMQAIELLGDGLDSGRRGTAPPTAPPAAPERIDLLVSALQEDARITDEAAPKICEANLSRAMQLAHANKLAALRSIVYQYRTFLLQHNRRDEAAMLEAEQLYVKQHQMR